MSNRNARRARVARRDAIRAAVFSAQVVGRCDRTTTAWSLVQINAELVRIPHVNDCGGARMRDYRGNVRCDRCGA